MSVRDRIAEAIQQSGMKQVAVAERLGEKEWWLSNRLIGRTVIKADELPKIAKALGVSACSFLNEPPPLPRTAKV